MINFIQWQILICYSMHFIYAYNLTGKIVNNMPKLMFLIIYGLLQHNNYLHE